MYKFDENKESLDELLSRHKYVLIQYGSRRCNPCYAVKNRIEQWNNDHEDVLFVYIDIEANMKTCVERMSLEIPTVEFYIDQKLYSKACKVFSLNDYFDKISHYLDSSK